MAEARCHLSKLWQDQDFQEQHENQLGPWQWMKQGVPEKMFKIASGHLIAVVQASPAGQKACSLENVKILQRKMFKCCRENVQSPKNQEDISSLVPWTSAAGQKVRWSINWRPTVNSGAGQSNSSWEAPPTVGLILLRIL